MNRLQLTEAIGKEMAGNKGVSIHKLNNVINLVDEYVNEEIFRRFREFTNKQLMDPDPLWNIQRPMTPQEKEAANLIFNLGSGEWGPEELTGEWEADPKMIPDPKILDDRGKQPVYVSFQCPSCGYKETRDPWTGFYQGGNFRIWKCTGCEKVTSLRRDEMGDTITELKTH